MLARRADVAVHSRAKVQRRKSCDGSGRQLLMAKLPYMRLYGDDLVSDTVMLSDAEFGAYLRIIIALWRFKGSLPFDHKRLAKIAGTTAKNWPRRWAAIEGYFVVAGGKISQSRVTAELRRAPLPEELSGAESGLFQRTPGEPRSSDKPLESLDPASARVSAGDSASASEPEEEVADPPSEHQQPVRADDWPEGGVEAWKGALAAIGHGRLRLGAEGGLVTSAGIIIGWRRDGLSFDMDVLPLVEGLCRRQTEPVRSWKFFDGAVRQQHASRTRPANLLPLVGVARDDRLARKNDNLARAHASAHRVAARARDAAGDGGGGD